MPLVSGILKSAIYFTHPQSLFSKDLCFQQLVLVTNKDAKTIIKPEKFFFIGVILKLD